MKPYKTVPKELLAAQKLAYERMGLVYKNLVQELESQEYGACTFELNDKIIKFRIAKITPTKIGQFVTFWKRIGSGPIVPYDMSDLIDFFVVSVTNGESFGHFVFPKAILLEKDILSREGKGGKHAIRVYPPWDITESNQARKTQIWQLRYFFEIQPDLDMLSIQRLLF